MTERVIYAKKLKVQANSFHVEAPLVLEQSVTMPQDLSTAAQNPLIISDSFGSAVFESPAISGPPVSLPFSFFDYRVLFGWKINTPDEGFSIALLSSGLTATLTANAPVITIPAFLPLGYRPSVQQDVLVGGFLGAVPVPNLFVFRWLTNGDLQVYKNGVFDSWVAGDQFRVNVQTTIVLRVTA